jgi:phenylacetic acid degradation operon negative regulatory protein
LTKEVQELAGSLRIKQHVQIFRAKHDGFTDPKGIVSRCWNLKRIHDRYARFLKEYRPKFEDHLKRVRAGESIEPSTCFVERFELIHEYRRFPFFDPDLPEELLPRGWLRSKAAALFQEYHDLLAEKANRYFDSVYDAYEIKPGRKESTL